MRLTLQAELSGELLTALGALKLCWVDSAACVGVQHGRRRHTGSGQRRHGIAAVMAGCGREQLRGMNGIARGITVSQMLGRTRSNEHPLIKWCTVVRCPWGVWRVFVIAEVAIVRHG